MNASRKPRDTVINDLVAELTPVKHAGRPLRYAFAWLVIATSLIGALMLVRAPFRSGFVEQLLTHPQFALETALGAAAIVSLAVAAFHRVLPASPAPLRRLWLPLVFTGGWLALSVYGLLEPALAPSMAGKRAHCHLEVMVLGLPALALGIAWLRSYSPLQGIRCGGLIGFAAGASGALLMQFACMYVVPHGLQFHILPGISLALIGSLAGALFLRAP